MTVAPLVSAIGPTHPLLAAVKQLGRKHRGTLGFFPDGGRYSRFRSTRNVSFSHPLSTLLRDLLRDGLALIQFPAALGVLQQSFGRSEVAGFHERLHLFAFGDNANRVVLLPEVEWRASTSEAA